MVTKNQRDKLADEFRQAASEYIRAVLPNLEEVLHGREVFIYALGEEPAPYFASALSSRIGPTARVHQRRASSASRYRPMRIHGDDTICVLVDDVYSEHADSEIRNKITLMRQGEPPAQLPDIYYTWVFPSPGLDNVTNGKPDNKE